MIPPSPLVGPVWARIALENFIDDAQQCADKVVRKPEDSFEEGGSTPWTSRSALDYAKCLEASARIVGSTNQRMKELTARKSPVIGFVFEPLDAFPLFAKLPSEIQDMVWEETMEPFGFTFAFNNGDAKTSVQDLMDKNAKSNHYARRDYYIRPRRPEAVPALQICSRSRQLAVRKYGSMLNDYIYFCPGVDHIHGKIGETVRFHQGYGTVNHHTKPSIQPFVQYMDFPGLNQISSLTIDVRSWSLADFERDMDTYRGVLRQYSIKVTELIIRYNLDQGSLIRQNEAYLREFCRAWVNDSDGLYAQPRRDDEEELWKTIIELMEEDCQAAILLPFLASKFQREFVPPEVPFVVLCPQPPGTIEMMGVDKVVEQPVYRPRSADMAVGHPRLQALERQRVRVEELVRSVGVSGETFGVE